MNITTNFENQIMSRMQQVEEGKWIYDVSVPGMLPRSGCTRTAAGAKRAITMIKKQMQSK